MSRPPCTIEGCGKPHNARGLCHMHYWRWKHGKMAYEPPPSRSTSERFWSKVDKADLDGCWRWTASIDRRGYGRFTYEGKWRFAHRVGYLLTIGTVPEGLELDHLCRVPSCVNPSHLEPVSHQENMRRSPISPTTANRCKTHCIRGHAFTEANTGANAAGNRFCRTCKREWNREYWRQKGKQMRAVRMAEQ